jgi:hypothetical protein
MRLLCDLRNYLACGCGQRLGPAKRVAAPLRLTRCNNFSSATGALGARRVLVTAPASSEGLGSAEPAAGLYLPLEQDVMGVCLFIEAADFGPFGGLLGPFWGSSAGAKNRASRAGMLNEKNAFSSRRKPRPRHREDVDLREGPWAISASGASGCAGLSSP